MNSSLRFLIAAGLFAATNAFTHARIERVVEKTFPATVAGTLYVETQGGSVQVTVASDSKVHVTARQKIRADSDAEADELLKKLSLTIAQEGNDVRARAEYEKQPLGFRFGSWPPVQVDFVIAVPAAFATDLRTSGGSIRVGDLGGKSQARTSGGSISLGKMGGSVKARTSGGSINLDSAQAEVNLDTSGGNITVGRVSGPAELSTSGGSIKIESATGGLTAKTSGGSIRAGLAGPLREECVLSTSGGSVRVNVDKAAAFRLDASTSGGSVDAEGLTVTLEKGSSGRSRLAGAVNGGGPLLKLRSSGGGIVIRAN